jgi:hypothetical protein
VSFPDHAVSLVFLVSFPDHAVSLVFLVSFPDHAVSLVFLVSSPDHAVSLAFLVSSPDHAVSLMFLVSSPDRVKPWWAWLAPVCVTATYTEFDSRLLLFPDLKIGLTVGVTSGQGMLTLRDLGPVL